MIDTRMLKQWGRDLDHHFVRRWESQNIIEDAADEIDHLRVMNERLQAQNDYQANWWKRLAKHIHIPDEVHDMAGDLILARLKELEAENERLRGALDSAGDVIASVVACCTYGSEAQAKAGAYGISHEAFTKIDQFIRKYSDILNTLDGVEPSISDGSKQDFNNPDFNNH